MTGAPSLTRPRRITVEMILTGSYRVGDGPKKSLGRDTFRLAHKDPSGAYASIPRVAADPNGPISRKKPSADDH